MPSEPRLVAILLAAGESRRMGRPKPLLEWRGATLIEYQVAELRAAGIAEVIAVLGAEAEAVRPVAERAGARVILNPAYRQGRAGSIRAGALAAPDDADAVLLLNVDQPRGRSISRAVLTAHLRDGNLITVPAWQGRRGHPVVLTSALLGELRDVREETEGLRAVMRRHAGRRVELALDDPAVLLDLNLPEQYEAALRYTQS
ncbi:MAG TPA: nucleotidyltransferase family protein [Steroidobacteraceae bacterium]|nr:nucleotidyltransferase family protein [Steroidobacteraceae bacterium]